MGPRDLDSVEGALGLREEEEHQIEDLPMMMMIPWVVEVTAVVVVVAVVLNSTREFPIPDVLPGVTSVG